MRHTITMMGLGIVGLALVGGCSLPPERTGDGDRAADTPEDWHFELDEGNAEVTARRGDEVLVYHLREMGPEGAELLTGLKGYDGATWTLPSDGDGDDEAGGEGGEGGEAVGEDSEALVNVPYPRSIQTPTYTTPGYGAPRGAGAHHGPPPGWNNASWGKACRIASSMAGIAGCAIVSAQCAVGTTITIGGLAIPCTLFIAFACTGAGWASSSYAEGCPR